MTPWAWLKFTIFLWLLRKTLKLTGWLLLAAAVIAAWPVTVVAAAGYLTAWLRGWPPARLYRTAAWALAASGAWLAALEVRTPGWRPALLAPGRAWARGWDHLAASGLGRAFLLLAPVALAGGLALGGVLWAWRIYAITTGLGGITASAPIIFDARQWNRQARTALGLTKAPGAVPLLARRGQIPVGGTIRAIGHKWRPVFALPAASCARHMVIIGATGSGKTNLMIRLWAGWFTATLQAYRTGRGDRPLLVVLDCKGGRDARRKADRTRRLLYGAGARRVAIWPDEARLCLWDLPPDELAVLLYQMIDTGTGNAAYYADLLQAVITLAILAPGGPPLSTQGFLDRLNAKWLQGAWGDGRHLAEAEHARAAAKHLPDIQFRYATLLRRLGPALDGPGRLEDADAWYCILEGTRERSVAEAQAMALTEMAAHAATTLDGEPRAMLLAADDYSAVSGRVPLSNLYERGRSLGIGVQVSAQSWQGLGATEDERYRIAATPTAASSSCTRRTRSRWWRWRGRGGCWRPRTSSSGTPGVMRAPPGSSMPGPPTPTWSAAWRSARRATSSGAPPPSSRLPGPGPLRSPCSRRPPSRPRPRRPSPGGTRPRTRGRGREAWMTSSTPETPDEHLPEPV